VPTRAVGIVARRRAPSAASFRFAPGSGGNQPRMFPMRQLDVYLNDHLAGATVGVELSKRAARSNRETPVGEFLERLHHEIVEDRRALLAVMRALGADISPAKPACGWIAEKAARLKLNGRLRGYSPLSRLIELEGLETGVAGKRSLWQALARAFPDDARLASFDLHALTARADHQLEGIREQRLAAAGEALAARRPASSGDELRA
jgi:hypothetical protein